MKVIQDEDLQAFLNVAHTFSRRRRYPTLLPAVNDTTQYYCSAMKLGRPVCRAHSKIEMVSREQR